MKPVREIVEAGAGCGKTYGLVSRYIRGLGYDAESGQPIPKQLPLAAREITALTFTDDAAAEMKERVVARLHELNLERLAESVLEESRIGTFHSLCLRLLRPHLKSLGYPAGGRIVPEAVSLEARKRHLLGVLASDPRRGEILAHLNLRRLTELVRPLWFRNAAVANGKTLDPIAPSLEAYENFRRRELELARSALAARPELASTENWLSAYARALHAPHECEPSSINFRKALKLGQELPALRASAEVWRKFMEKNLPDCLSSEAIEQERAAHALIDGFFAKLRETGPKILDYAALEFELHALLMRAPNRRLMPAPKLLLVDEFQDTNRTQYAILRALSNETTEWYFVGDPKQSIYKFRGADVSLFRELCGELDHRLMSDNWRSDPPALEFVNRLQEGLFRSEREQDPEAQPLASGRHSRPKDSLIPPGECADGVAPVRLFVAPSGASFVDQLVADFRGRSEEFGPAATHAALFTSWKTLHAYAAELGKRQIPFAISGAEPALDHQLTFLFADTLEWIDDPRKAAPAPLALLRWTEGGTWSPRVLSPDEIARVLAHFGEKPREAGWSVLLARFAALVRPSRWPKGAEWTAAMSRTLQELETAGQALEMSLPEFARFLKRHAPSLESEALGAIANPEENVARMLLYTVHGSKGLQFDCVYLPELKETRGGGPASLHEDESGAAFRLKMKNDASSAEERPSLVFLERERRSQIELEAESRRLFYVAATRVVRTLDLYLHAPSKTEKPQVDPFSVLGWPERTPFQWNKILLELRACGAFRSLEQGDWVEWREAEAAEENDEDSVATTGEVWLELPPIPPPSHEAEFFREGVSRYLERESKTPRLPARSLRPEGELPSDHADLGTEIHALLEIWNGRAESLERLLEGNPLAPTLRPVLQSVRALPELGAFWEAAADGRDSLQRELGLYVHSERYRLSGFADAVWFRSPEEVWILDWKTSSSLRNLARADRIRKIHRQLALYAEAFRSRVTRIRGGAVGIEVEAGSPETRVEFLFLEDLLP